METNNQDRHQARQQRIKEKVDARIAAAQDERGLLIVITGDGKGKSTSGFGTIARATGHGLHAGVVQFIKGTWECGERILLQKAGVEFHVMATGFTWETQDSSRDATAAQAAWELACTYLANPEIGLVVLDEFTYPLKYGWLDLELVIAALAARPPLQHVIITGRAAPEGLIAVADTVTDMTLIKHAFKAGVKAMPGLEW